MDTTFEGQQGQQKRMKNIYFVSLRLLTKWDQLPNVTLQMKATFGL